MGYKGTMPRGIEPSNLDKVFWPDDGLTKGDLIDYFEAAASFLVPAIRGRPLTVKRYPDGIDGWMAKLDVGVGGGLAFDPKFFVEFEGGLVPHQVRLQGGDASSDSFCFG